MQCSSYVRATVKRQPVSGSYTVSGESGSPVRDTKMPFFRRKVMVPLLRDFAS